MRPGGVHGEVRVVADRRPDQARRRRRYRRDPVHSVLQWPGRHRRSSPWRSAPRSTELVGLVNGLTAAAAGIGALGLVALPTLDKIKNAYTAISAAQTTLAGAKAKEALAPSKANETAVKNAQITLDLAQKSAGPVAGAVAGVQNLAAAFGKMATSFQPQVLQIFNQAIGIAAQLLPTVATFAQAAAPAVEEVMKSPVERDQLAGVQGLRLPVF